MPAVIKKPNRKSLYAVFRNPEGKQIWRSTGTTDRKQAMEIALQLERAERLAGQGALTAARARELLDEVLRRIEPDETLLAPSVEDYVREWLEVKATSGTAESSLQRYRGALNTFLKALGPKARRPITVVTRQDVEKWRKRMLSEGRSPGTVNYMVKILGGAFEGAVRRGEIPLNPARAVDPITGITAEGDRRIPFTHEQVQDLIKAASDEWIGMILLAYHCGLRLTDAAGLTWASVDLSKGVLTYRPKKLERRRRSTVSLILHSDLVRYLESRPAGDDPDQAVFASMKGRSSGSAGGLSNEFMSLIDKAGIRQLYGREKTGKGRRLSLLSFHSLRHSFVSKAHVAAKGTVSGEVLKGMSGHSTDAAHEIYVHLQTTEQRAVVDKFESVL